MTEAVLALLIDACVVGFLLLIWYLYKQSKAQETGEKTKTVEAPTTPAPEKEFPVGAIIGVIAVFIVITAIALLASNSSDDSSKIPAKFTKTVSPYQVTQNPDGSVTLTADAKEKTEALISYKKGQKITFTATGTITGSTNPRDGANRNVGPEGWSCEPSFLQGRQKMLQSAPFMGLLGKLKNGEWFYIGRGTSITTKTSGEKIIFIFNDAHEPVFADNGGYCMVTIRVK